MNAILLNLATDVVAITIVSYGIYFRRYYRRDLLLAYIALNVGIFAVTALLSDSSAGVGLGLGLFGILSIVRLRSDSITQEEIAYYFVALALGLIGGLTASPTWLGPVLSAALVVVMFVVDHPRLTARAQRQTIVLDRAYPDRVRAASRAGVVAGRGDPAPGGRAARPGGRHHDGRRAVQEPGAAGPADLIASVLPSAA